MKRTLSSILALILLIGMVPFQASAESKLTMTGDGSVGNPYIVLTLDQLDAVRNDLNAYYKLGSDIDASETANWNHGEGFIPIGGHEANGEPFTGVFDGGGHIIHGLTMNRPQTDHLGLFGVVGASGVIQNVGLEDYLIIGKDAAGGLVGDNHGVIDQSYAIGSISGHNNIGGLIGQNDSGVKVTNSYASGSVMGNDGVGGLVGWNSLDSVMEDVYATGSVSSFFNVGGLAGFNSGSILSAYANVQLSGQYNVGGLVGLNNNKSEIDQSYAAGSINGMDFTGGLVGRNESGKISNCYAIGTVEGRYEVGGLVGRNIGSINMTYASGHVTGTFDVGGLVGREFVTVSASFYNRETTGQGDTGKGEPLATTDMKRQSSYSSAWDFNGIWTLQEGKTYPVLRSIADNIGLDAAPPTVVLAKVETDHPDRVIVTFDEEVNISDALGIAISAGGVAMSITRVEGTGTKKLTLSVSENIQLGEQVLLSYDPLSGNIVDLSSNALLGFTDRTVDILEPPADMIPPSISITMTKADGSEYVDREWTNQSVKISAAASDDRGVTSFTYSLDSEVTWKPYLSDIILSDEGMQPISFKARDAAGNETIEQRTVNISTTGITLTPTTVKADGSVYTDGKWTNTTVTVSVYAKAGVSKIADLTYRLDDGPVQTYQNKAPVEISEEGEHTILFQASDHAGNTLASKVTVRIDKTLPSIRIAPNGSGAQAESVAPKVVVADTGSGVDTALLEYVWTADKTLPATGWMSFSNGAELAKSGVNGDWYLHIRAADLAGNKSNLTSGRFRLVSHSTSGSNAPIYSSPSVGNGLASNVFLVGEQGRTINFDGGYIIIPPKAVSRSLYVTVNDISSMNALSLSEGERLASKVIELKKDSPEKFAKDVTIALRLNSDSGSKVNDELRLVQLNPQTNEWEELHHVVIDWDKGMISGTTDEITKFAVIARAVIDQGADVHFTDIKGHWAENMIEKVAKKGVVNGYKDGSFQPDRMITRAEFTTILVRTLGLTSRQNREFADTHKHWAKEAISTAYSLGIVQGFDQHTFAPDAPITREQIAVMLVRAWQLDDEQSDKVFGDQDKIAKWAQKAVMTATENGLINGYPSNMFQPKSFATRAEAITVIWRIAEGKL